MTESLIRELIRFQDTLRSIIPETLWYNWVEANEEIIDFLQKTLDN